MLQLVSWALQLALHAVGAVCAALKCSLPHQCMDAMMSQAVPPEEIIASAEASTIVARWLGLDHVQVCRQEPPAKQAGGLSGQQAPYAGLGATPKRKAEVSWAPLAVDHLTQARRLILSVPAGACLDYESAEAPCKAWRGRQGSCSPRQAFAASWGCFRGSHVQSLFAASGPASSESDGEETGRAAAFRQPRSPQSKAVSQPSSFYSPGRRKPGRQKA